MPSYKGRDVLLKIGDGGGTEVFTTIGAARTVAMSVDNRPVDATAMDSSGVQGFVSDAGVQSMQIRLDGLFKDASAEELLRVAAFTRTSDNYQLFFANGDTYEAAFVVQDYARGGSYDGLETFSVTLLRNGDGTFTPAA